MRPPRRLPRARALQLIAEQNPDALLLDLGLPDSEGLDLLRTIRQEHPQLPIIVVTANDSLNNAIASIKEGAFHFISKPYVPEELLSLVAKALEHRGLRQETIQLREETERLKKRVQRAEAQLQPVYKNAKMRELSNWSSRLPRARPMCWWWAKAGWARRFSPTASTN